MEEEYKYNFNREMRNVLRTFRNLERAFYFDMKSYKEIIIKALLYKYLVFKELKEINNIVGINFNIGRDFYYNYYVITEKLEEYLKNNNLTMDDVKDKLIELNGYYIEVEYLQYLDIFNFENIEISDNDLKSLFSLQDNIIYDNLILGKIGYILADSFVFSIEDNNIKRSFSTMLRFLNNGDYQLRDQSKGVISLISELINNNESLNIYDLDNDYADIIINTDNNLSTYYLNNDNIIYKKMNLYINDIFLDRVLFNKDCDSYHYIISNYHGLEYDGIRDLVELLDNDGKLMLVISKGFLFRSHEEKNIREYLIDNNLIDAIIDIPPEYDKYNIKEQVLIIIKKQRVKEDILFVYNENVRLRSSIIKKIVDFYILYQEEDNFSKFITIDQIKVNEYNLSINKYFINEEIIIEDTSMLEKRLEIISSKNEANKKELLKLLNKY